MKKKYRIQDPAHPFHAFAKKETVSSKIKSKDSDEKSFSKKRRSRQEAKAAFFESRIKKKNQPFHYQKPTSSYAEKLSSETGLFPLNKYVARTGLCARRKAVEYIKSGEISVNGRTVTEPGFKVNIKDEVCLKGKKLFLQREPVYILLNKPKGYITTTDDPRDRKTVMELVSRATAERVYPVGRLDRNTSGLLLLTNDGDLAQLLAHPGNEVKKLYHVTLDKPLIKHDFEHILNGIELEDGLAKPDALGYEDEEDKTQIGIEIHIGRNRIVRRIFEHLGYEVKALDRVLYAGLTKKNLPRGRWRLLSAKEIVLLKHLQKYKK